MNADGSGQIELTHDGNVKDNFQYSPYLAWSPDGKWITFTALEGGKARIFVVHPDGSNLIPLTESSSNNGMFYWSPDARRILFASDRDGNPEIYTMNSDDSGTTHLTNNPAFDTAPAFSPDGSHIAFRSDRDGHYQLYIMNADGSGQKNLSNNNENDNWFWWSPDGRQIFLSLTLDQQNQQWRSALVNIDGSGRKPFIYGSDVNWRQ